MKDLAAATGRMLFMLAASAVIGRLVSGDWHSFTDNAAMAALALAALRPWGRA